MSLPPDKSPGGGPGIPTNMGPKYPPPNLVGGAGGFGAAQSANTGSPAPGAPPQPPQTGAPPASKDSDSSSSMGHPRPDAPPTSQPPLPPPPPPHISGNGGGAGMGSMGGSGGGPVGPSGGPSGTHGPAGQHGPPAPHGPPGTLGPRGGPSPPGAGDGPSYPPASFGHNIPPPSGRGGTPNTSGSHGPGHSPTQGHALGPGRPNPGPGTGAPPYPASRPPTSSVSGGHPNGGPPARMQQPQEERRMPVQPQHPQPHSALPAVRSPPGPHPGGPHPPPASRPQPPPVAAPPAARFRPPPVQSSKPPPPPPQQQQQPPPPPPPHPPAAPTGGMRELRVEDALLYLDDVKREFGDRPRIYNEFLEIMKNFKSQEVDTPGVIQRVSRLFRGYNNLILGFNKFLPDGYKITIEDIDKSNAEHRRQQEAAAAAAAAKAAASGQAPHNMPGAQSGYFSGGPQQPPSGGGPGQGSQMGVGQPGSHLQGPGSAAPKGSPPALNQMGGGSSGGRPVAQGQPQSFQKRPPGAPPSTQGGPQPAMGRPGSGAKPGSPTHNYMQQHPGAQPGMSTPTQQHRQHAGGPPSNASQQLAPPGPPQGVAQQQPAPQHQAVEFDHAISYVTNIKKRFASDPSTYHSFLEILHTYQKEQRGIKEVLEQVAALFADHPDLLKEFTFFLPDAVQEQAKERLHRAAADSEARQAAAAMEQRSVQFGHGAPGEYRGRLGAQQLPAGSQKIYDMTGPHQGAPSSEQARDAASRQGVPASRKRPFSPSAGAPMVPIHSPHPETFVYNSAVERQFFDAVKEALMSYSRDGGQAWAEFLKCLDMYAQEILSRSEMLNFVEPLLGKRNAELFEEFKRILAAAGSQSGSAPSMEDSWYSVPLSEIDFSRCRRCSPSYRALPRDYPAPPCSERTDEESKVLNDIWVSLPVGSEESYTFRHMRRNTYEETMFRCEDERFEIDMVIDSNAATLRRLEPISEEIAQLSQEELITPELSSGGNGFKPSSEAAGMGGKKYQYTFDQKKILGTIHRNSIARLYGDSGQEMLDLMVKNPTVAIPIVVKRLRQKDREWQAARDRMNRHWKELAEMNYYKSLDNRALTWRTIDKRATSTRTLVAEIKDRAAHGGNEGEAALAARLDKAKEEHGSFYEVTMREHLTKKLDLTDLPKPDEKLFTPHLSLMYENDSWAQRDAYRIIAFALERGSTSPADKERCHRLWREFLGPWFHLSLNWMQRPALDFRRASASKDESPIVVSNGEEDNIQEDDSEDESSYADDAEIGKNVVTEALRERAGKEGAGMDSPTLMDHHFLPKGSRVSTVYGEGTVSEYRRQDHTYVVSLRFGATAFLQPSAVLCSILSAEKSGFTNQLRSEDSKMLERPDDVLAIGTQSLYLFFRLHQILIRRLGIAKDTAYKVCNDRTLSTLVEQMQGDPGQDMGRKRYDACLSLIYALIAGGHSSMGSSAGAAEGGKYEDRVRCLLGHGAYELATMDKLISHIVKNLQNMAGDETMQNLVQLFRRHLDAGSFKPDAFRQEAAYLSDGENLFAFQYCKVPDADKSVLHTEFLGVITESDEESEDQAEAGTKTSDVVMTEVASVSSTSGGAPPAKRQRRGYRDA